MLYLVLDDPEKVKHIRRRIADCRNPMIKTRDYIPPQFFQRYSALGRIAADMRRDDQDLKTQIRFGASDIALWTKTKRTDEPFKEVNMEEIERIEKLPRIEHKIKWNRREEHPVWRQASPEIKEIRLKSLGGRQVLGANSSRRKDGSGSSNDSLPESKRQKMRAESSDWIWFELWKRL